MEASGLGEFHPVIVPERDGMALREGRQHLWPMVMVASGCLARLNDKVVSLAERMRNCCSTRGLIRADCSQLYSKYSLGDNPV